MRGRIFLKKSLNQSKQMKSVYNFPDHVILLLVPAFQILTRWVIIYGVQLRGFPTVIIFIGSHVMSLIAKVTKNRLIIAGSWLRKIRTEAIIAGDSVVFVVTCTER